MAGNFSGESFSGGVGGFDVDPSVPAGFVSWLQMSGVWVNSGVVAPPVAEVVSGGGGIDPSEGGGVRRRRTIVKPTGLVDRPRKQKEPRKDVEDRVEETREIHAEIAGKLARELRDDIVEMTMAEVDQEIGVLLRKVQRTQEEDLLLLMLIAVS